LFSVHVVLVLLGGGDGVSRDEAMNVLAQLSQGLGILPSASMPRVDHLSGRQLLNPQSKNRICFTFRQLQNNTPDTKAERKKEGSSPGDKRVGSSSQQVFFLLTD
jgi:hypothetical protein